MIRRQLADGRTVRARENRGIRKRCGCPHKAWQRCKHPWHANFSHKGREYRVSLHKWAKKAAGYVMLQTEAESLFKKWTSGIEDGQETTSTAERSKLTIDALATMYLAEYVKHPDRRPAAAAEMARQVRVICDAAVEISSGRQGRLGNLPAATVTKPMVESFRHLRRLAHEEAQAARTRVAALRDADQEIPDDLLALARRAAASSKSGRVSTNRLLARLRHLYTWAISDKELLDDSPFVRGGANVIKLDRKAEGSRSRRLEGDEEDRILMAAGSHLHAVIVAALETGMRRGEILGIQWKDVREDLGIIDLPPTLTKTGIARQVVITPRLSAILEMRKTAPDGKVFGPTAHPFGDDVGHKVKSIKTAWRLACRRAEISGLRFHDLRRESGSRLLETPGVSLTDVRDYLGHRDVGQTNTYLSTTAQRLREAVQKRDAARTNLAQPPKPADTPEGVSAVTH